MGQKLTEDNLEFDFTQAIQCIRFDDDSTHGLSHCMKRVDFIVETMDNVLFIEVKDLDNPEAHYRDVKNFIQELKSKKLITSKLVPKARDSFLYNYLMDNLPEGKPKIYIVFLESKDILSIELLHLTDVLKNQLPVNGPLMKAWNKAYYQSCLMLNMVQWNRFMSQFPVRRIS